MFIREGKEKGGKWTSPRNVLSVDRNSGTVTLCGAKNRNIVAAVEDTRIAVFEDEFAEAVVESIDKLDEEILDANDDKIAISQGKDCTAWK